MQGIPSTLTMCLLRPLPAICRHKATLAQYPALTKLTDLEQPAKQGVNHHILITCPPFPRSLVGLPVSASPSRVKVDHMLQLGIVVSKKDPNDWLPCSEFQTHKRLHNSQSQPLAAYPELFCKSRWYYHIQQEWLDESLSPDSC